VPDVVILGGPNGAGKTTAAKALLPDRIGIREFVNADEIARGLSPFNPDQAAVSAGRIMLERIRALMSRRESFAFETTCSGRAYAPFRNMRQLYLPLADEASIYDNSDSGRVLIAERRSGSDLVVRDAGRWQTIESVAA
jgi:predicted ABC-type ATPase